MEQMKIRGRKIGSKCPACKKGRLCVITHNVRGNNGIMGPNGRSWSYSVIDRLACKQCSASFEVEEKLRGSKLEDLIEGQLKDFKSPEQKPTSCKTCRAKKLVADTFFAPDPFDDGRGLHETDRDRTDYLYCGTCCKVLWAKVTKRKAPPIDPALKKALDDFLGEDHSDERD